MDRSAKPTDGSDAPDESDAPDWSHSKDAHEADFGPCCSCGQEGTEANPVRTILCLDWTAPVEGTGWGCAVCNRPSDGALAVLCDACAELIEEDSLEIEDHLSHVVDGMVSEHGRLGVEEWMETRVPFSHDESLHRGAQP
jgi:hypothetical protein